MWGRQRFAEERTGGPEMTPILLRANSGLMHRSKKVLFNHIAGAGNQRGGTGRPSDFAAARFPPPEDAISASSRELVRGPTKPT